jgi:hypothetical protein
MRIDRRNFVTGLSLLMAIRPATAQIVIPQARLDILTSDVASHALDERLVHLENGRVFRIFRAIPKAVAPAGGSPVLYMLDGNGAFDNLTRELLTALP